MPIIYPNVAQSQQTQSNQILENQTFTENIFDNASQVFYTGSVFSFGDAKVLLGSASTIAFGQQGVQPLVRGDGVIITGHKNGVVIESSGSSVYINSSGPGTIQMSGNAGIVTLENIVSAISGGSVNATSLVGYPIITSSLAANNGLKFYNNEWVNYPLQTNNFFTVLSTPTNASGTGKQELTRFNIFTGGPMLIADVFMFIGYSIENGRTGSIEISSSVDNVIYTTLVSGTSEVEGFLEGNFAFSGSSPYYINASSSNADSNFKIYYINLNFNTGI